MAKTNVKTPRFRRNVNEPFKVSTHKTLNFGLFTFVI